MARGLDINKKPEEIKEPIDEVKIEIKEEIINNEEKPEYKKTDNENKKEEKIIFNNKPSKEELKIYDILAKNIDTEIKIEEEKKENIKEEQIEIFQKKGKENIDALFYFHYLSFYILIFLCYLLFLL